MGMSSQEQQMALTINGFAVYYSIVNVKPSAFYLARKEVMTRHDNITCYPNIYANTLDLGGEKK